MNRTTYHMKGNNFRNQKALGKTAYTHRDAHHNSTLNFSYRDDDRQRRMNNPLYNPL